MKTDNKKADKQCVISSVIKRIGDYAPEKIEFPEFF